MTTLRFLIIFLVLFSAELMAIDVKTYIPPRAFEYKDTLESELDRIFPELPEYNFVPALIEHESCITLTHSKCWSATSELRTSRENGIGFFQLTRAWTADGRLRFDTVSDLRRQYPTALHDASWDTLKNRPDVQIRAGLLLIRQNYNSLAMIPDPINRMHMTDAAHNAGAGNVQKERRACGLAKNCDPNIWINNVEHYCLRSKKPLYAGRSACDITQHHVRDVFFTRLPKYQEKYIVRKQPEPEVVVPTAPKVEVEEQQEKPPEKEPEPVPPISPPIFEQPKPPVEDKQPEEVVTPVIPETPETEERKPGPIVSFFKKLFGRA